MTVLKEENEDEEIFVACDDGTIWSWNGYVWMSAAPAIPGTEADVSPPDDD